MCNKSYNFESNGITIIEDYENLDNKQFYDLLLYQCTVNNIDRSFVIGSIVDKNINIDEIDKYISKIISFRFNNTSFLFISGAMHEAKKNGIFDNVNLSNETYNLFMNYKSDKYFEEKFIYHAKETMLDKTTKRFSIIHNTEEPFNSVSYYDMLEEQIKQNYSNDEKILKKVI